MKMIFLGPPGAGKGTVAAMVSERFNIPHISTGDLFRENAKKETELGLIVKSIMDKGDLVPDEVTVAMVKERLNRSDASGGFILDGFPRTVGQAEALWDLVAVNYVFNFQCPEKVLIQRLTGRRQCRSCGKIYHATNMPPKVEGICDLDGTELYIRNDDKPEAVKNRLKVYAESTAPLINWYKNKNLLQDIDSSLNADKVIENLHSLVGS